MFTDKKFGDVRDVTYQTRCEIGFASDFHVWEDAPASFSSDELVIQGHPVMERWEESYMEELAAIASAQGGTVLEVGFGMGISAEFIQTHAIDTHIIIEANKDVFKTLEMFATESSRPIVPLLGFWEEVSHALPDGSISGILFDTYPLSEKDIHKNHFMFFKEAYRLLRTGGVLTYYSDEIDDFSTQHMAELQAAGFKNIEKKICTVTPPQSCQYWKSNLILAPIITK
jgi:guanidinoacetate N-methyltransferase